jgi:hypothetical protein
VIFASKFNAFDGSPAVPEGDPIGFPTPPHSGFGFFIVSINFFTIRNNFSPFTSLLVVISKQ